MQIQDSLSVPVPPQVIDALHLDWKVRGVIDFSVGGLTVGNSHSKEGQEGPHRISRCAACKLSSFAFHSETEKLFNVLIVSWLSRGTRVPTHPKP